MRITILSALIALSAGVCQAQGPKFEVASIKPSGVPPGLKYAVDNERVDLRGMSLSSLIDIAFGIQARQLTAPDWTSTALFDIAATLPPGATKAQVPQLLQALLADRFGLVVHHETKDEQVYALLPGKDGLKLADAAVDNTDRTFLTGRAVLYKITTPEADGFWSISVKDGRSVLDAQRITMAELATILTARKYFEDPVVDMTGLKGYWQLRFDVPKNSGQLRAMLAANGVPRQPEDPDGISIPGSLRKFGLEIQHRKVPVDHVVVDHIERTPTEN